MKKNQDVKIRFSRTIVIILTGCMLFIIASNITADPHYPPNEYSIPLKDQWNLITVPVNASIPMNQITIRNNSIDYNFTEAVSQNIIIGHLFGWDRQNQTYFIISGPVLKPGQGYWIWAYYNCSMIIHSDVRGDGHITGVKTGWNIMGQTYNSTLALANLLVDYNGTAYSWVNATSSNNEEGQPLIIAFIFNWNTSTQSYGITTKLTPGEGDWIYAYFNCTLRQQIDPPIIIDNSEENTGTGNSYVCNASVSDPDGVTSVWLQYWYGSNPYSFVPMNPTGVDSYYEKTLTIPSTSVDSLHYIIAANDTKNHWNTTSEQTVSITDDDVPIITNVLASPSSTSQGGYINISCDVADNIAVNTIRLNITYPDLSTINVSMNTGSEYYLNQSYSMSGTYEYFILANDTSNNINISSTNTFTINFTDTYTLILTKSGTGDGTIQANSTGPFYYEDVVRIWANASTGSSFAGFTGSLIGLTSPQDLIFDGDEAVDAAFILNEPWNNNPVNSNPFPINGTTGQVLIPQLAITISDADGDSMNVTFRTNATGTWEIIGTNLSVENGTYRWTNASMDEYNTTYWWSVNTSDGMGGWDNDTYHFTTKEDTVTNSNPDPSNGETDVSFNPTLTITVADNCSHLMNVTFRTNATGSWGTIDWNASSANGTYRQTNDSMDGIGTTYWWSVNTSCSNGVWDNDTYSFTTAPIETSVDTITQYSGSTSPLAITVTGDAGLDNVTLYYRYSANNYSDWSPGKDYAVLTAGDHETGGGISYPQRMWYDEENQLLYVVNYLSHNMQIWDVTDSDAITKLFTFTDTNHLQYPHDVVVKKNWSYNGKYYGNIAFMVAKNTSAPGTFYLTAVRCNLSTSPSLLGYFGTGSGESYKKLGYVEIMQRGACLYAAVSKLSGKMYIVNVTDPGNMVNMSYIIGTDMGSGQNDWWWLKWSPDTQYIYVSGDGTNSSTVIIDTSDLENPTYAGYAGASDHWLCLPYYDRTNLSRMYVADRIGSGGNGDDYIKVYNTSNPENWVLQSTGPDHMGTGEWQTDFYTNDWGASRKYSSGVTSQRTGIVVWNLRNITDIYNAGVFKSTYTNHSHMQWFDYNNSRIFCLAYSGGTPAGGNCIYIVKWNISLAQSSSWYEFGVDTTPSTWSWDFTFPNGAGYYEFCSIGKKTGIENESFPVVNDAMCYYSNPSLPITNLITSTNQWTGVDIQPTRRIMTNDIEGGVLNFNFSENSTGSLIKRQSNYSVTVNSTVEWNYSQALFDIIKFWWKTTIDDSTTNITRLYH